MRHLGAGSRSGIGPISLAVTLAVITSMLAGGVASARYTTAGHHGGFAGRSTNSETSPPAERRSKLSLDQVLKGAGEAMFENLTDSNGRRFSNSSTSVYWAQKLASSITLSGSPRPAMAASTEECPDGVPFFTSVRSLPVDTSLTNLDPATHLMVRVGGCAGNADHLVFVETETLLRAFDAQLGAPAARAVRAKRFGALKKFAAEPDRRYAKLSYRRAGGGSLKAITLLEAKKGKPMIKVKTFR